MSCIIVKFLGSLVLAIVLLSLMIQAPLVQSSTSNAPERTLSMLRDVLQIDMTKYSTELTYYAKATPDPQFSSILPDVPDEYVRYTLERNGAIGSVLLARLKMAC